MSADEMNSSRRKFLANVAGSATALAAVGLSSTALRAQGAAATAPQGGWDMTWLDKVAKAKHKQVFDAPAMADGMALTNAAVWLNGYSEVYKTTDADMAAVIVFRHKGVTAVLNDELWSILKPTDDDKAKDPAAADVVVTRNPFLTPKAGERGGNLMPNGSMDALISRGMIVIGCNLALMRQAGPLSKALGISREEAQQKLIAGLVPGVIRMPSGVFATTRAEEAGCGFLRST